MGTRTANLLSEVGVSVKSIPNQFLVQIKVMDDQHLELALIANQLAAANHDEVSVCVQKLLAHTAQHFSTEESLMDQFQYASADSHRAIHQELLQQGEEILKQWQAGTLSSLEIAHFIKAWLFQHIQGTDQFLGYFLRLRGVK